MTKAELITQVAQESDITKKAAGIAVDSFVQAIHDSLKKKNGMWLHSVPLRLFKDEPVRGSILALKKK